MLVIRKIDFVGGFPADIDFSLEGQLNDVLDIRSFYDPKGNTISFWRINLELVRTHLHDYPLYIIENYMKKPSFLCYSKEGATAAPQVVYVVFILIKLNVSVKSRHALIDNMNLVLWMSPNGASMFFQGKTGCQRRLALLNYEFVDLFILFLLCLGALSFFVFSLLNLLSQLPELLKIVLERLTLFLWRSLPFLENFFWLKRPAFTLEFPSKRLTAI